MSQNHLTTLIFAIYIILPYGVHLWEGSDDKQFKARVMMMLFGLAVLILWKTQ